MQLFSYFYVRGIVGGLIDLEPFLLYILFRSSTLVVQYKLVIIVEDILISKNSKSNNIYSMNKKKMIVDKYNTVYCFDMYVVLNPNKAELDKRFEWLDDHSSIYDEANIKLSAYSCIGVIDKSNGRQCFVVIINELGVDELFDINTIAHEAFHVTMDLLNTCRLPYSDDSCEAYAYLLGYLTECIYKTAKKA